MAGRPGSGCREELERSGEELERSGEELERGGEELLGCSSREELPGSSSSKEQ